jgi:flagellar basal body-associated protein FliL
MSATTHEPGEQTAAKPLMAKLKIPAIIIAIVLLEWGLAFLVMPSSSSGPSGTPLAAAPVGHGEPTDMPVEPAVDASTEDHSHSAAADAHGKKDKGHGHEAKGHGETAPKAPKHSDATEVDLGNFTVSGFQPASNSTLFITFHLYGTVRHKYSDEFGQRLSENQHRIRDNIIVIIRSAEITDLTDAGLGLIKRRILETTNKTLGKPLLQEVVFSDFSFIEQ